MLKDLVQSIEAKYIQLMRGNNIGEPLSVSAHLNCTSMSYLLAHEMLLAKITSDVFLMAGHGKGLTDADGHVVTGVVHNRGYFFVDSTIWQVFPNHEHMLIGGPYHSTAMMTNALINIYSGRWERRKIPEYFLTEEGIESSKRLIASLAERRGIPFDLF